MKEIEIPFSRDMAIAAIDGKKVATTRSEAKGEIGDIFDIRGIDPGDLVSNRFRIIDIKSLDLLVIRNEFFRLEGFDSPEAFEKTWRSLHRGHFTTGKLYFMHVFARIV